MFRKEFNKDLKIQITEVGAFEKREIDVKKILSFQDNDLGQAVIQYQVADDQIEEIITRESSQKIADLIDGEPSDEAKQEIQNEVVRERQTASRRRLEEIESDFERDKDKGSEGTEIRLSQTHGRIQELDTEINQYNDKIRNNPYARFLNNMRDKIDSDIDKIERLENITGLRGWLARRKTRIIDRPRLRLREGIYSITAFGQAHRIVSILKSHQTERDRSNDWIRRLQETREQEKDRRHQAYVQERQRLIRLKDDPELRGDDRLRLMARIREYREEHGNNHYFKFERQRDGKFENVRSKEFQERKRQRDAERAKDLSESIQRRRGGRSRGRVRSRSRDMDRER